ncbi:peptidylprolyl isomerase [Niallia sp. 01092]|uniref:peptidylprolyl isomerase n=1 Tax=unclassified Niallia TaxID=2837522 RepID=UPI003FD2BD05
MKKWILSLTLAASVIGLSACSNDGSEAIVKTDAGDITKNELYDAMKEKYGAAVLQPLLYEKVLEKKYNVSDKEVNEQVDKLKGQYGDQFLTVIKQYGYNSEDELREFFKTGLLQQKAAVKEVKVTDDEIKAYYDEYKPEIKARHILVADEKTAKEVKQKLDKGEKFEDLAKKYSTDPGSKDKGGDLGWFGANAMVPEFEKAAYALKVNEISNPVKSEHDYHIIQVTDKKEKGKYEDVKDKMAFDLKVSKLTNEDISKAMQKEIKDANVKIEDKDLKSILDTPAAPDTQK